MTAKLHVKLDDGRAFESTITLSREMLYDMGLYWFESDGIKEILIKPFDREAVLDEPSSNMVQGERGTPPR